MSVSSVAPPRKAHLGLVHRAAVRRYALDLADRLGRGRVIRRIGEGVYADCERVLRQHLAGLIEHHPSGFRTLEADHG